MIEVDEKPRKRLRDMTPDERREHRAEYMRNYRRELAGEATADNSETREEFWGKNRARLSTDKLAELQAQDSAVRDQLWWIRCQEDGSYNDPASPHYCDPKDEECYVGIEEGIDCLVEFVKNHPCPRTYAWNSSSGALSNKWSMEKFWADPATMELIVAEGDATEVWARYGYWTGIEDAKAYFFLTDGITKLGHKKWSHDAVCKLLGMVTDSNDIARYPKVSP